MKTEVYFERTCIIKAGIGMPSLTRPQLEYLDCLTLKQREWTVRMCCQSTSFHWLIRISWSKRCVKNVSTSSLELRLHIVHLFSTWTPEHRVHTSGPGRDSVPSQGDCRAGPRLADTHIEPWYSHCLCSHYYTLRLKFFSRLMAVNLNCKHELLWILCCLMYEYWEYKCESLWAWLDDGGPVRYLEATIV